jgi:hypothetical protein
MVASPANRAVKTRLLHELGTAGVEVQRGTVCGVYGSCAFVENVSFRIPGANPGRELLLTAHYDSVAAGAGAGDDGSGVGILLELRRLLQREKQLPHPVTFLFTDGEELGLLGAKLYAQSLPDDAVERVAINVEARGTSGPSLLFDVADSDAALLQRVAPALTRTFTSSLFPLVYRKLPNDTDLTALRRANVRGVGFAFIGRVDKYHTSGDDHASVHVASVHHQGQSVHEATRALLDPRPLSQADALEVFFDLFGFRVVRLSVVAARSLALVALFVFIISALRARHTRALQLRDLAKGGFAAVLGLGCAAACGGLLEWGLRGSGRLPGPFLAKQSLGYLAALMLAAATTHSVALLHARVPIAGKLFGTMGLYCVAAVLTAFFVPQACFLFLLPACVSALVAPLGVSHRATSASAPLFALATTVLWAPLVLLLGDAIGLTSPLLLTLVLAICVAPIAAAVPPMTTDSSGRRRLAAAALAWGVVAATVGAFGLAANYSEEVRQRVNIALEVDADSGHSRWLLDAQFGSVPPAWSDVLKLTAVPVSPAAAFLGRADACAGVATTTPPLAAPEYTLLEATRLDAARVRLILELRSLRGAHLFSLLFDLNQTVSMLRVNDAPATLRRTASGDFLAIAAPPDDPLRVELVVAPGNFEMQLADRTAGFGGHTLPASRPSETVASQWGDSTVVVRRIRMGLAGPDESR